MNLLASWVDGKEQLSLNPIVIILEEKKKTIFLGFVFLKLIFYFTFSI